jgi:hypothetical protein
MSEKEKISVRTILSFLWHDGDLRYKLDSLQLHILDTILNQMHIAKKICVLSSRQIGKSYGVVVLALIWMIKNPGGICRIIAPTKQGCNEIVEDNLNVIIADCPPGFITAFASRNRWNLFNGSSLRIGALEKQYVNKNRGGNAGLIIYEECGFVSADDFRYGVNSVLSPQLMRSKGHEVFITSPSEEPDHPIHTEIAPKCELLGTLFNYMVFESPSISIDAIVEAAERSGTVFTKEQVSDLLAIGKRKSKYFHHDDVHDYCQGAGIFLSDHFRRELMAEVIRPTSLMVIPHWYETKAVYEFDALAMVNWQIAIDWGGVRDKTVGLLMGYLYTSNEDVIIDEVVFEPNTTTEHILKALKELEDKYSDFLKIQNRWADLPTQTQVDLITTYKYQVALPQKADWLGSVNYMASRFSTNRVKIHPRCKFLITSVKNGMFNKTRTDFARTEALGHMDALAALMYGMRMQNKSNPYPHVAVPRDHVQEVFREHEDMLELKKLTPKRFGKFKHG